MWSLVKYPSGTNSPDKKSIFGNRGNLRIKGKIYTWYKSKFNLVNMNTIEQRFFEVAIMV